MKASFDKIYENKKFGPLLVTPVVDLQPFLKGFFGYDRHTMNSQACKLGIPSMQLELAPEVRENLAKDDKMIKMWAQAIVQLYLEVIVP